MKIIITENWLTFHDPVPAAGQEYAAQHDLTIAEYNGKYRVKGKPAALYGLLLALAKDNDIDLI